MSIYDSKGNELKDRPDYSKGRLLQVDGKLVYFTWEEKPDVDEQGNVIDHTTPVMTLEQRVQANEDALVELASLMA